MYNCIMMYDYLANKDYYYYYYVMKRHLKHLNEYFVWKYPNYNDPTLTDMFMHGATVYRSWNY